VGLTASQAQSPTLQELEAKKAELEAQLGTKKGEVAALEGDIAGIKRQMDLLKGWHLGLSGLVGFQFANSNDWQANPNPNASSSALNVSISAFANLERPKYFWRNTGLITKAWNDIDVDGRPDNGDLFDNGTVDILNISSLGGYKLNNWVALSALGELNTSLENFFSPGTFDIGIGATLTPVENLVIVLHPLNYHLAFSGFDDIDSQSALGMKFRAEYTRDVVVISKKVGWSSVLTGFVPYSGDVELVEGNPASAVSLFNYTWLNTVAFSVWKGIGVGVSFGIRGSELERFNTDTLMDSFDGPQTFYSIGLTYAIGG